MIRETVNWLKSVYSVPSAEVLALREIENAKRSLLEAQSGREYAEAMCKYHEARIKRLSGYFAQ